MHAVICTILLILLFSLRLSRRVFNVKVSENGSVQDLELNAISSLADALSLSAVAHTEYGALRARSAALFAILS